MHFLRPLECATNKIFKTINASQRLSGYSISNRSFGSTASNHLDLTALFSRDAYLYPSSPSGDHYLAILPEAFKGTVLYDAISNVSSSEGHTRASIPRLGPFPSKSFYVQEAGSSKGLGLFAAREISAGDDVLQEQPVLFAALTRSRLAMVEDLPGTLAALCRAHLSPSVLEQLMALSTASAPLSQPGFDGESGADPLGRVLATNTVRTDVDFGNAQTPDSFAALLLQSSRCNHR